MSASGVFYTSLWESLIGRDWLGNLAPRPGLATEWRRVDDQTVELKLRQGVKFHNGDEMTAEDVVFTFSRGAHVRQYRGEEPLDHPAFEQIPTPRAGKELPRMWRRPPAASGRTCCASTSSTATPCASSTRRRT